jgi:hypothetical protein
LRGNQIAGLNGAQTIEFWVRPAAASQNAVIVATTDDVAGWSVELNNGQITWWYALTNGTWGFVRNTTAPAVNTWSHIAVVYTGTQAQVFVNGVGSTLTTVGTVSQGPFLRIGGVAGYGFLNGQMDEVRISNIARYTATFTPPTAGFTTDANTRALYRFNESSGQTTADASGNNYTLTLGTSASADTADPTRLASTAPTQ